MPILRVSSKLIQQALLAERPDIEVTGAGYDPLRSTVLLQIEGPDLPDTHEVTAEFTAERRTIAFKPA